MSGDRGRDGQAAGEGKYVRTQYMRGPSY